jgi:hypothetical protein
MSFLTPPPPRAPGCSAPFIVKPVVACGTPDSHAMALALWPQALAGLAGRVPLPAVVQEFVNHDATIYKVYVAGDKVRRRCCCRGVRGGALLPNLESILLCSLCAISLRHPVDVHRAQVFHTVRPSIPNVPHARPAAEALAPSGVLTFDSLKSLPTALPSAAVTAATGPAAATAASASVSSAASFTPSQEVLERLAGHLRSALGLSLFGFDVVVRSVEKEQEQAATAGGAGKPRELVVVDINYFPSYRGAKGAPALFRAAIMCAHHAQVPA